MDLKKDDLLFLAADCLLSSYLSRDSYESILENLYEPYLESMGVLIFES